MCDPEWLFKVLVIVFVVEGCHLITTGSRNGTAEILWSLSGYALQNKQSLGRQIGGPANYQQGPVQSPGYINAPQNFGDALASIAYNDELHCVPRLLCELTSGSRSATNTRASLLPFNINMDSLLGLLSSLSTAGGSSPLVLFGNAALVGYMSKGSTSSCQSSFPRCPSDPDKLVNYLNNYNGGFFRYFSGIPRPHANGYYPESNLQQYPHQFPHQNANQYQHQYPLQYPLQSPLQHQYSPYQQYPQICGNGYYCAQEKILTKPQQFVPGINFNEGGGDYTSGIKFPASNEVEGNFYGSRSQKSLTFPQEGRRFGLKSLNLPTGSAINHLDFQRPLPNHIASPNIFPMRTGTGELILDTDAFDYNYRKSHRLAFTQG